ncbi:hypothetical protein BN14_06632 [Rhizoctonia solani AG-1 IB]|uniref:Uncharacterized protein n=2 Tax=Rhizoctonia solani TaxID=456999 RepID=A0A8H2Y275_9AGAM|nr:unnamed protein product [Rhizoctonia solani]CCO32570.1 hypothetical protein BN14_06632 [Rhizoctonia solani AG-1 IB]
MPEHKGELTADEVATLSKALRVRAAQIKKTTGNNLDQYKALLIAGQDKLIPEPAGEPGRDPATICKKTGKPRGYHLWAVLGLKKGSPTHGLYRVLQKEPIFHCYEDNWPIHAYIKGLLTSRADSKRKLSKKVAQEEDDLDVSLNGDMGSNGPDEGDAPRQDGDTEATLGINTTAPAPATSAAPSAVAPAASAAAAENVNLVVTSTTSRSRSIAKAAHQASEQFDKDESSSSSEDDDPPPVKRQRQNRKSNMPRVRNPNGNTLQPASPSGATAPTSLAKGSGDSGSATKARKNQATSKGKGAGKSNSKKK